MSASASIRPAIPASHPPYALAGRYRRYAVISSVVHPDRYVVHDDITRRIVSGPDGTWRTFLDRDDAVSLANDMNAG